MTGNAFQNTCDLIAYVWRESDLKRSPAAFFVVAASASRTGMIYAINETAARNGADIWMLLLLFGTVGVMLWTTHMARMSGHILVQALTLKLRERMKNALLGADTTFFQKRDQGLVYAAARDHIYEVAQTSMRVIDLAQAVLLMFFCLIYLATQSWISILAAGIALVFGAIIFAITEIPARRAVAENHRVAVDYHDKLTDLLRGYKELRLRQSRRIGLSERMDTILSESRRLRLKSERYFSLGQLGAAGALAVLLVAIVVIVPVAADASPVMILQIITLVLFSFGPIESMVGGLPGFVRAAVSMQIIREVEADIARNAERTHADAASSHKGEFQTLELRGVSVTLTRQAGAESKAQDSFTLGPIDLTLRPGQSVFVTGGNGMGKSTLLQLLTGLRYPDQGEILLDGELVTRENIGAYRSIFGAVFSEFYMFRELYGLTQEERARLLAKIPELGLAEGVSLTGDRFASLSLSTGQMRRLALAIALAEQRPIMVLDEFAADQDPSRRRYFYEELVPHLARDGHCVVAVTHDEHCFDKCDRLIRMEDGKIVSDSVQKAARAKARARDAV